MATIAPFSTTSAGNAITLANGEDAFIRGTTVIVSTGATGIVASLGGHAITVLGEVYGDSNGVVLGASGLFTQSRVSVGPGGAVTGRQTAIDSSGSSVSIDNAGLITGNEGIDHNTGSSFGLANSGTIAASFGTAVSVDSGFGQIVNHGVIAASFQGDGIFLTNSQGTGSFVSVVNFGRISGYSDGIQASGDDTADIRNHGEVGGDVQTSFGDDFVLNTGTIAANISVSTGNDTVINRGLVDQDILLSTGDDSFDGRGGLVLGEVQGSSGDDLFLIDDASIALVELAVGGNDTVRTWVSFTLPDHIEELFLQGDEEIDGTGNDQANTITGNSAANIINGGGGDDMLLGGWGNDSLFGDDGNDTLRGHAGSDLMAGGLGDDTYFVNVIDDQLVEYANEGTDHVHSPVSFALRDYSQHLENLTLSGTANIDGTGNGQVNTITGNSGDNVLNGAAAGDILLGGAGNDTFLDDSGADQMSGGPGDDTYFVDNPADQLIELAGEGVDSVFSPISFALRDKSQHLENLTLTGSDNVDGTGNGQVNTITGNSGDNVLNGAGAGDILVGGAGDDIFQDDSGADQMAGGTGDDTYFVDNAADSLIEFAGEGTDSVFASLTFSLRDKSQHLENLTLTGGGNIDGTGNGQANIITGNSGDNTLNGAAGNDTLNGGAGDDIYNDDSGADRFEISVFDGLQNDEIMGFVNTADTIAIELGAFDESTVNVANLGGNTIVTYGDGLSTLLLSGVTLAEVDIMFSFS